MFVRNIKGHQSLGPHIAGEKFPPHLFHLLSHHKHRFFLLLTGHWLKWKGAHVERYEGRSERKKKGWDWSMLWGWGKMVALDRNMTWQPQMSNGTSIWSAGMMVVSCIVQGLGGWWCWKYWSPIGEKLGCGGSQRLYPANPCSPPTASPPTAPEIVCGWCC